MRIAYLRAAFGRGLILAGKTIRSVSQVRMLLHVLRPPFRALFARPVRVICYCFASLVLSVVSAASYAEGSVNPTLSTSAPPMVKYYGYNSNFDTPEAACADMVAHQWDYISTTDLVYDHVGPSPRYPENFIACYSRSPGGAIGWFAQISIMRSCDGMSWVGYAITCTRNVCPANSTGAPEANPTACTCNAGYVPNPTQTSCVQNATCPIPLLTPLTDPVAIDFNNNVGSRWRPDGLTPAYQEHVRCVEREIRARGGTPEGTSAYRPNQYQRHLFEIVEKDALLDTNTMIAHPECRALRDEVTREMGPPPGHGLRRNQLVATPGTSRHESGTAFDLTPNGLNAAQRAEVYATCGVTNRAVRNERWHTE